MNRQHSYVLVEGQQDVYFVGRLLQTIGLQAVQNADDVPPKWEPFLDSTLRQRDRALRELERPGVAFWQMFKIACFVNDSHVVAVESVGGNRARFAKTNPCY